MAGLSRWVNGNNIVRVGLVIVVAAVLMGACQTMGTTMVAPAPDVAPHRVDFKSGDGVDVSGYFYKAKGVEKGPAVIMLHGCGGLLSKRGAIKKREAAWREILLGEGYHVLLLDSFNPRGHRSICRIKSRPVLPNRERPHDAYAALAWMQSQPLVDASRVALAGWSNGAMAMLWSIRDDARQRPKSLGADFIAAVGFYPGCIKIGRTDFKASTLALLQVGLADRWTLPKPCIALVAASNRRGGAPMKIDGYEDAAHGFDHPNSRPREITTRNSVYKSGEKKVYVGTNHQARNKAIIRVKEYLRAAFARRAE
jgi:dienelactone hydrolase